MCAFDGRSLVSLLLITWGVEVVLFEIVVQSKQGRSDSGGCGEVHRCQRNK